ncbi:methylated-DNA--[protein]-cysteine S-methyltransferase [Bacillus sp. 31A1R]|uniref:Methylated-DNA--protein-cysteine methyltransferase n=1 Tax=Robertmurraya mangrovi TaxID=3098077 RepID=A0ABU5ITP4_9BACI|nr:methylated-DNA--[protein]-cysteine S-methyltransferase [Bacillus sp. 31A1R]MDZ5470530.1 methylated-DNA--[protein]-cysteine S-methyltransferase [Bacillus sp. 31A1R]
MKVFSIYQSPIGAIYIISENEKVVSISLGEEDFNRSLQAEEIRHDQNNDFLTLVMEQFEEYFSGQRKQFDLPIEQKGTSFQQSVWNVLKNIPFGETLSYQEVANLINNPKAVRAIGQANKANQLPIIIPCHRVIGKNQSLTGYAGTRTDIKERLLTLEGAGFKK